MGDENRYPDLPRVAVGAFVFHEGRVLLVRRGKPPAEGQWAIPGGAVNLGETLQRAAEREIREETGIVIQAGAPMFTFDVVDRDPDGRVRFHYVIIDLSADYIKGDPRAADDAREARWVAPAEMAALPMNPVTTRALKDLFDFGV
ncbi:MAG: NUDIX hydrolase [Desulfobacterales bacterium]|nr:NUDIX hydrolase [Desulfobacterales bacterium]